MIFSSLQRYILKECLFVKRVKRGELLKFYSDSATSNKIKNDDLTASLERLVNRGLLNAYGRWSADRWFIDSVALTAGGKKIAKQTFKKQISLPLFALRKKK
jgi:hypothetical protein